MNKNNSGFTPILILLIVGALGAVGFFLYKNSSPKSPTSTQSHTIPSSPSNPSDLKSNWKTYVNPVHHYSIQYPPEYIVGLAKDYNPPENLVYIKSPQNIFIGISYGDRGTLCANNSLPCDPVKLIKATIEGRKYEPQEQYYMNDTRDYNFKMYIDKQIDIGGSFTRKGDATEVNQILSTFKFTN